MPLVAGLYRSCSRVVRLSPAFDRAQEYVVRTSTRVTICLAKTMSLGAAESS